MNEIQRSQAAKKLLMDTEASVAYDEAHDIAVKMRLALQIVRLQEEVRELEYLSKYS